MRQKILEQTKIFQPNDLIPVPCNPDALVMGYALKLAGQVFPMTRYIDPAHLLNNSRNTIVYEQDEQLHQHMLKDISVREFQLTVLKKILKNCYVACRRYMRRV